MEYFFGFFYLFVSLQLKHLNSTYNSYNDFRNYFSYFFFIYIVCIIYSLIILIVTTLKQNKILLYTSVFIITIFKIFIYEINKIMPNTKQKEFTYISTRKNTIKIYFII